MNVALTTRSWRQGSCMFDQHVLLHLQKRSASFVRSSTVLIHFMKISQEVRVQSCIRLHQKGSPATTVMLSAKRYSTTYIVLVSLAILDCPVQCLTSFQGDCGHITQETSDGTRPCATLSSVVSRQIGIALLCC